MMPKQGVSSHNPLLLRKLFSMLLAVALLVLPLPAAAYGVFSDVQGHWGQTAIEKWSGRGIIRGADGAFRPDDPITRGEMAVVIDRVMHYQRKAENRFADLGQAFYTDAVLKANAAGVIRGDGTAVRPADKITREEAAVMLGRALGLKENPAGSAVFSDAAAISPWAAGYINAMAHAGYVRGSNGQFRPHDSITRAEVVTILDHSVKQLCNESKEYTGDVSGTAVVNTPGVALKDMTISGDLIIAEGVGNGDITLNHVIVAGNTLVRGGGSDSIHIEGGSHITALIIEKTDDGSLRIVSSEGAAVDAVLVEDGSDDIILTGAFDRITVAADVAVKAVDARIGQVDVSAENAVLSVDQTSVIGALNVAETAAGTEITVSGRVETLTANAKISVNNQGTITRAQINANGVAIDGHAPSTLNVAAAVTVKPATGSVPASGRSSGGSGGGSSSGGVPFAGGSGTVSAPYQVATAAQLDQVRNYLSNHFVLTADIDLSGYNDWKPIGVFQPLSDRPEDQETPNPAVAFTGTFDGNGHTISNVKINLPTSFAVGLFGCVAGTESNPGSIHDLTVKNVNVTGYYLVGGVVGFQVGTLENIRLIGHNTVRGSGQCVGGIAGVCFADIKNCRAEADIVLLSDDGAAAGVLVGSMEGGSAIDCWATAGTVKATGNDCWGLGGLAGGIFKGVAATNCHAANVAITASGANNLMVGGLLGFTGTFGEEDPTQVTGCSAESVTIAVSDSTRQVGGLVGGGFYLEIYKDNYPAPATYRIMNCETSGSITGGSEALGSIAGYAFNSTVDNCTSTMTVNGDSHPPQVGKEENGGILVVAHGSPEDAWNQPVRDAVAAIHCRYPAELGFLEYVAGENIGTAVANLEKRGVKHIIAVPIFVASASDHIEEIKYLLGLPSSITEEAANEAGMEAIPHHAQIEMTPAMDDHPLVAEILKDRIATVSQQPDQEIVVLAAHGTTAAADLAVWKSNLASLGQQLKQNYNFLDVDYGFAALGEPQLRTVVEAQQAENPGATIIVMPVMLSESALTDAEIPGVLAGLTYVYPAKGQRSLLPDDNISQLIVVRAYDALAGAFAGGSGIVSASYQVAKAAQLDPVCNYLDKNFILTANIDLSGYENWTPIGTTDRMYESADQ